MKPLVAIVDAAAALLALSFCLVATGAEVDLTKLPPATTRPVDFAKDVQPLLADKCYSCHGPDRHENDLRWDVKAIALRGGSSGPAIVPGHSAESRMIHLVAGLEKGLAMPKKGPLLTPEQIGLLRAWIDQGAPWPDELAHSAPPDKADWWAFKPAVRPPAPQIGNRSSPLANPIDSFIHAKLAERRLAPSREADRRTLIRRLTFDLTGLPPTPEELERFLADPSPDAYEKLVDRLLASPRYGERWARHWLDVVHFGETHGYDKDKLRPNAWPYRDYVIRSFNKDKPYSRFVEEQLAGDILFPDDPDGIIALGFIAAGPWDYVGHVELPITKTDGLIARYNDRDDMVMTTLSTFQSLTVHCARCHDHKFDPITQKDYYGLQAVFAGVDRANRPFDADRETHRQRCVWLAEKKSFATRQEELHQELAQITSPALQQLDRELAAAQAKLDPDVATGPEKKSPSNGYHSQVEPKPDSPKWGQVDLGRVLALEEIRLVPARPTDFPDTPGFGFPVRFKVEIAEQPDFAKAEVVADHTEADFKNPGDVPFAILAAERFNPAKQAGPTLTPALSLSERERENQRLPKNAAAPLAQGQQSHQSFLDAGGEGQRGEAGRTPFHGRYVRVTATRLWERTKDYVFALAELQAFAQGTNVARGAVVTALDSIEAGRWATANLVDGYSSRSRLSDALPTAAELARRRELESEVARLRAERGRMFKLLISPALQAESVRVETRLAEVQQKLDALPPPSMVYAAAHEFSKEGNFAPPNGVRAVHLLARGDVTRPKDLVAPAGLPAVPGPDWRFDLPDPADEGTRRAALARWITDPKNLLTRRSIVNRVWQYHFGKGLADTPNDFGHQGALPTHPELLDWLAFWFGDNGESLKKLHRLLVTSATYRQTSLAVPFSGGSDADDRLNAGQRIDADNRYLWRMNRARLDAECIRDALLFVSGRLDLTMGGPSDRQFFFKDDHSPVYDYTRFDVDGRAACRRSVYRHLVRSVTDPFMDCLDAADPSQLVARRNTTLTALQALATLNNPFVLRQCEHFAERLNKMSSDVHTQIEAACQWALGRKPAKEEAKQLAAYAQKHGLANACRVIFNSTEFMFVD
ncbi:MAG: PSD1 domain-containing protein [Chloroflexi bacterium]|nr:PSD1 domain-containing protein [Chloroflexota bacterium]